MLLVCRIIQVYALVVIARVILEYVPISYDHPVARVRSVFRAVTDPLLIPIRSVLPTVRMGGVGIDLSPLVLIIGLNVLVAILC
jgi:YggT family protein